MHLAHPKMPVQNKILLLFSMSAYYFCQLPFGFHCPTGCRYLASRACERSGSGAENGAERAEKLVSGSGAVSGTSEKRQERSGARSGRSGNGNGAVSGSPKNWWSVERHFSPLPLRSHALLAS
jgi:hypothetical protein